MTTKIEDFNKAQTKGKLSDVRPGDTVRVVQKIREEKDKEAKQAKAQSFEGLVIARKHGKGVSATITVRKLISGIGVERVFPLHSPLIEKIDILRRGKARRAKLYYLREAKGRKSKLKKREIKGIAIKDEPAIEAKPIEEAEAVNE